MMSEKRFKELKEKSKEKYEDEEKTTLKETGMMIQESIMKSNPLTSEEVEEQIIKKGIELQIIMEELENN